MSKITKWKTENTKVKVVFRLQFHATHVPQTGWDKLFVSFIPADTGKVTAKTTKANVRNGSCKWSDPIYETTRLLQDPKTKNYDDKLYKLVVAMGSSRSGILGEASINLADYVDASKPSSISLPLQGCNLGTVLHVAVQLLTSKTGFREFEQQRELRERGIQMLTGQNFQDEAGCKVAVLLGTSNVHNEKVSAKVRFKSGKEFPSIEEDPEMNEDCADSAIVDGSSYTSESLYTEKQDTSSTHENEGAKSTLSGSDNVRTSADQLFPQGSGDWIQGWCTDVSLGAVHEENSKLRSSLEFAESSIIDLQLEVNTLKVQADEMAAETQRFAKQLVAEIASGEKLAKHISLLKLECSRFKDDFEKFRQHNTNDKARFHGNDSTVGPAEYANQQLGTVRVRYEQSNMLDKEYKYNECDNVLSNVNFEKTVDAERLFLHDSEVNWLQNMFLLEDKIKVMKEMACRNKENDLELITDLESLECLTLSLKYGSKKLAHSLNMGQTAIPDHNGLADFGEGLLEMFPSLQKPSEAAGFHRFDGLVVDNNLDHARGLLPVVDLKQYDGQGLFHCSSMPNSMAIEPDTNTFVEMKEKISELSKELEVSKVESNNLAKKMDLMECYYETLIRELEGSQQLMQAELQTITNEHRSCLYTIATLENQAQKMHNDKDDLQARFFAEKHALDSLHEELEKRAVTAETALKRLQKSYCIATDQLLKDLETLSYQVLSMYETNEEVARQSFTGATQHCLQESKETFPSKVKLHPRNLLLKEQCETKDNGACPDAFLMDNSEKCLLQENTVSVELTDNIELKGGHSAQSLDACLNHLSEAQELQRTCKGRYYKMLYLQEDREDDSDHLNLNMGNTSLLALLGQLDDDQAFDTNHANLITKQLKVLASSNSMNCQRDEISISSSFTMPVLESQPCDKSDALNCQAENKELKRKLSELDLLLTEANRLLLLQRELHESSENKLMDTESVNLYLEIFSLVLMETVQRAQTEIVAMPGKQKELIQQLEHSTKLKELLIVELQDSSKHVKLLQESEAKNSVRHDELVMKNNSLETFLEDLLKEKSIFVEKLKEHEMRVTDLVIYKEKYASCTVEVEELKNSLEEGKLEKVRHEYEITLLKENFRTLQQGLAKESSTRLDKEKTIALLQYSLENLRRKVCDLHETIADKTAVTDVPEKLDHKDLEEDIFYLEQLHHEAQQKLVQLFEEKKETEEQLKHAESQIVVMKEKTETEVEILKLKLEESTEKTEKLQAELVDMTDKYMLLAEAAEKCAEKRKLSSELATLKVEMQSICEEKDSLAKKVMGLESSGQELEKIKVALYDSISENKTLRVSLHSAKDASIKQMEEVVCLKGTLRILEDELRNVSESKDKLEAELANSTSQLNEKQYMNLKRQPQLDLLIEEGKVSLSLTGKLLAKAEDELSEIQMLNLYLEIFSLVLQETLKRALVENMTLNKKKEELDWQLEHFIGLEENLTFRIQTALESVKILQENEARSKVICEDLILKTPVLEKTLQDLLEEKSQFAEKLRECEMMAVESVGYKEKYEACIAEKKELQRLHEKGKLQMVMLDNEVASLKEALRTLTIDLGRESSERDEQDKVVASVQKRLQELRSAMLLFSKSSLFGANSLDLSRKLDNEDIQTTIAHVEELQREVTEKFLLCCQEKNEIEEERDLAQRSLRYAESEVLFVKEKSEMDMKLLMEKLDESNSKLEQLSVELVDVTSKFQIASEMEETHAKENMKLSSELSDLKIVLQSVKEENVNLLKNLDSSNEVNLLKENLRTLKLELEKESYERDEQDKLVASMQGKLHELRMEMLSFGESGPFEVTNLLGELDSKDIETTISHVEELQHKSLEKFLLCCQEKKAIQEEREIAQRSLEYVESQVLFLKEKSQMDVKILMEKLDESSAKLNQLSAELIDMTIKFEILSEMEENHVQENMKLFELSNVKIVLESVQEDNRNLLKKLASSNDVLSHNKRIIHDYMSENKNLTTSLQSARDESAQQLKDLDCLKENFRCLQEEVHLLRISKDERENALALITCELNEKHEQLVSFTEQKIEFLHLKQQVLDLTAENSKVGSLLLDFEEHKRKLIEDMRCAEAEVRDLENDMDSVQKLLLADDIDVLFLKSQVPSKMGELYNQISVLHDHIIDLQTKLQETPMTLDAGMASEAQYVEEKARTLEPPSVELEVDAVTRWGGDLKVGNIDFQHLNVIVLCLEEELKFLKASRDELDITNIILFCKLDELNNHIICLDGYNDELNKLRAQNSELTQRLSEQVLKTDEFRNLSIHLQELNDRTDTTHNIVKKAADEPSFATQESLRIAFIREQCETKLQELRSQLYLSRKHSEELLLKLQIALDELEARKKSEAAYARKSEDLSLRVHELEAELQSFINDMRERAKDYNQLKTELEVSMLSLMCSKEEKENLEISLQECQNERMKLSIELTATKEELENHIECQLQQGVTVGGLLEKQRCKSVNRSDLSTMDPLNSSERDEVDVLQWDKQSCQGITPMDSLTEDLRLMLKHNGNQVEDDRQHMQCVSQDIKEKSLFSSMERLQKELERMKNENLAPLLDQMEHHSSLVCEELFQREMSQLNMANEQLRNVFPQFNEFLESGNALERVLALEIELAEALQSKKKDTLHFQSSFLKQHNDEEAIFKSFRDINELIKDMVELKKKNLAFEAELKEMHNRYSQLSVQFAEVEGERQKLVMTLKNIRSPRKL